MTVFQIDPIQDPRWAEFLHRHPRASVFHTPRWLGALWRTYGYEPVVLTTSAPDQKLSSGLVFCHVNSRLTGRRLVSVPFSDHCEPLVDDQEELEYLLASVARDLEKGRWKYIELRPLNFPEDTSVAFQKDKVFHFHVLDLRPTEEQLVRSFQKDSTQRKIRRAEREGLTYEEGRTEALLEKFYTLLLTTRRRHQLPPPPRDWFRNLIACLGDQLKIRVASREAQPVASILTLRFKDTLVYKYGCSDARFHNLGGIHLLLWRAIQEAKNDGLHQFDLGRSDVDNEGLATFKDRWGAARSTLTYWRYPGRPAQNANGAWKQGIAKQIFAYMPDRLLTAAGKLLYKHIA